MKFRHSLGNRIALTLLIVGLGPVVAHILLLRPEPDRAAFIVLFSLLLVGLASLFLTRSIVSVLRRLVADTERLARGDLAHRAVVDRSDEMGSLAQAFNDMAHSLEQSQARLLATQEQLATQYRELHEANEQLDRLWEVSTSLTTTLELDQLLPQVGQAVVQLIQAPIAWVVFTGDDRGQSPRQAHYLSPREDTPQAEEMALSLDDSVINHVIESKSPLVLENLATLEQNLNHRELERLSQTVGIQSLVALPLLSGDNTIGVLAYGRTTVGALPEGERELVDIIAGQATIAIENARLFEELKQLSDTDSLTRMYNHRYMMQRLDAEIARARRYSHSLSVLLADLDNFKLYNDSYGHLAGDAKLRAVAASLKAGCRASDVAGRYGGDEFIILLPETTSLEAEVVAQRLRVNLAADGVADPLLVTASIGISAFPVDGGDRQTLIAQADAALYAAKGQGGNAARRSATVPGQLPGHGLDAEPWQRLILMLDTKDDYLKRHTHRVSQYALALAERQGLSPEERAVLALAASLHDIGRIGISEDIWNKPGPLTDSERRTVQQHPLLGVIIAGEASRQENVLEAVRHHHERYDGAGYPGRLEGTHIPALARILAVADAYAAMTVPRPYRPALSHQEAIVELRREAGNQFDPELVEVFIDMLAGMEESTPQESSAAPKEGTGMKGGQP